ncbi:MAG: magnesium transporter [SAR324 cluster bacterium]|nr:magnesium transporter [SAR324 cluster bacterium]
MDANTAEVSLQDRIRPLLHSGTPAKLKSLLRRTDPVDMAAAFFEFPLEEQLALMGMMPKDRAAAVLCELDHPAAQTLLLELDLSELARLIPSMEPDDAADIVGMMEKGRADELLARLPRLARDTINYLLSYDEESAGGLMDPDVVRVGEHLTVKAAIEEVRRYVERVRLDEFFSFYVVTSDGTLVGTVPNWKMLLAKPQQKISEIMDPAVVAVEASLDQEVISRLVRDHDLVSVPVVDEQHHLIGRITHDDIVDVIDEEHEEDLGRLTGTMGEEVREHSLWHTIRLRFPWLFVALVGEFLLALFMKYTENFLLATPQLAFFFPLIMAMGGTSGIQSSSLVIRGLATGEIALTHWRRRVMREFVVALAIGLLFAILLIAAGSGMTGDPMLAIAVGLATMAGILLAATGGTAIPIALSSLGFDPALATGPFITTLNDIVGILVYLGIAYLLMG